MDAQFTGMTDVARPSVGKSLSISRVSLAVWIVILAFAVTAFVGLYAAGLTVHWASGATILPIIPVCAGLAWYYRARRPDLWISSSCDAVAQLVLILILSALCSYAAIALAMPLQDARLLAADRWLGLDWLAYNAMFNDRLWLAILSRVAYYTLLPQLGAIIVVFIATKRLERLPLFLLALALSLVLTVSIAAIAPAVGCYVHLQIGLQDFPNLAPTMTFLPQLEDLRAGAMHVIHFNDFQGLMTFPSFHACGAILAIWAFWCVPYLRWGAIALNIMMLASTPVDGTHYFVDVLAGIIVAVASIAVAQKLAASLSRAGDGISAPAQAGMSV